MNRFLISTLLIIVCISAEGQSIRKWAKEQNSVLYEKVYLHTDRELYSTGDTIWFKAYHVSGVTHKPIEGYKNIYVHLVSPEGEVVASRLLLSIDGESFGDIAIPDTLNDAQYTIRAFTKYLEKFGEESYFHKRVIISRPRNSTEVELENKKGDGPIEVMFFPEGGTLVANAVNHIAFKAIDHTGRGIAVKGELVDEAGSVVAEITARFLGMGEFVFMPKPGKVYKVRIDGHPEFNYYLEAQKEGVSLHCRDKGTEILVSIARNFNREGAQPLYLAASHKGVVLFYKELEVSSFSEGIKLSKNLFARGISKITLMDMDFRIVAERLVFIDDNSEPITLELNKGEFTTREEVKLEIKTNLDEGDTLNTALSVSVVNEDYLSSLGNNQTIESFLLLDSELKGAIESPARYFTDEPEITSAEKLDLLMMVQGWRSYYWDEITEKAPEGMEGWADAGLKVEGFVKRLFRDKPVVGGEVVLGPFSRNFVFEETKTDKNGRFSFDRLFLRDTVEVMINSKNERDRPNTEIILDPLFKPDSVAPIEAINNTVLDIPAPMKFYRRNYLREMAEREYHPEKGVILLGEVDVFGNKPEQEDDMHYRLYSEADNSFTITEDDYMYEDIFEYLSVRAAGVAVSGTTVSIRGGEQPLFLLDGVAVEGSMVSDLIYNLNMRDIDKIEIMKSGASTSFYGSQGGNGVIAIYTRHGDNVSDYERYIKGRIVLHANGFQHPNSFYSPKYTLENIDSEKPDNRPVLYWEPMLKVKEGMAKTSFFTGDELGYFYVFVEGVSKNGKICQKIKKISVTTQRTDENNVEGLAPVQDTALYEKVYLHIDRELYSPGDTVWFKSYLTRGITNMLQPGYKNIYVDLVSPTGEVIADFILLSENGEAWGEIGLNDSLPDGEYCVRAYTKYLRNFGEQSYFHKQVWVKKPKSSVELNLEKETSPIEKNIELLLLPESGFLVANAKNVVAFRLLGSDGKGVEGTGKIINNEGILIANFETSYLGMGKFTLTPEEGKIYTVSVNGHPEISQQLGPVLTNMPGIKVEDLGNAFRVNVLTGSGQTDDKHLYLMVYHKGIVLFQKDINISESKNLILPKNEFPTGISKLSLLNQSFESIAERLVFVQNNSGNSVKIETQKMEFKTREKVTVTVEPYLSSNDSVESALSLSVVNNDYLTVGGYYQNILSYLLIDSEIKGYIESPTSYFYDEDSISSAEKLDLLMMVHGWRSYFWDDITERTKQNLPGWLDAGISINGTIKDRFRNEPEPNAKVKLGPYSPDLLFEEATTNKLGQFNFERLYLRDSTEVLIMSENKSGGKNVKIFVNPVMPPFAITIADTFGKIRKGMEIPLKYYRNSYLRDVTNRTFIPDSGSIVLDEIDVVAITSEDLYELTKPAYKFFPDASYMVKKEDYKFRTIYDYLLLKVGSRGLEKTDEEGNPILELYLDGRLITKEERQAFVNGPINNIYRIDKRNGHLPNAYDGGNPETYYFYRNRVLKGFEPETWGKEIVQVHGFQKTAKFYSPTYTPANLNSDLPDLRPTLFWSPEVSVRDGKAEIDFFTCDDLSDYTILVEGISKNGKICYGTGKFSVTGFFEN